MIELLGLKGVKARPRGKGSIRIATQMRARHRRPLDYRVLDNTSSRAVDARKGEAPGYPAVQTDCREQVVDET